MMADIENLLRELPLTSPGVELDRRVLGIRARRRLVAVLYSGAALAAAAVLVLAVVLHLAGPKPPAAPLALLPTDRSPTNAGTADASGREEVVWSRLVYQGSVVGEDGLPLRAYRQESVRQVQWVEESGQQMQVVVPREQLVLVPAEMY